MSKSYLEMAPRPHAAEPPAVWVRVIPVDPKGAVLERLVELTPYMVQTIVDDARGSGRCRRLEVILGPGPHPSPDLAPLLRAARTARLAVEVHRGVARHGRAPARKRSSSS